MSETKHKQFMYDLSVEAIRLYNKGYCISIVSIYDDVDIKDKCILHEDYYEVRIVFKYKWDSFLFSDCVMNELYKAQTCIVFKIRSSV